MSDSKNDGVNRYASPPCFMYEVDPVYMGGDIVVYTRQRTDVNRWRKAERKRLIEVRLSFLGALVVNGVRQSPLF